MKSRNPKLTSPDSATDDFAGDLCLCEIDSDDLPLIFSDKKPGSGIYGAVFNLTTSTVGAGIMALPATMKVLGPVSGTILIFLVGVLSGFSVELLVRFASQCKARTYGDVVEAALGRTARTFSETFIILNNLGALVVYLIIVGDVLSGSSHHIGVFDQWWGGRGFRDHSSLVILAVLVLFLAPLCSLARIDSLSVTSAASVGLAVVFVVVSVFVALVKFVEGKTEFPPRMASGLGSSRAVLDLLVVIPVVSNAYLCHFNVHPVYNELVDPSPEKMYRVGRITTLVCVLIYVSAAVSGYLLFGDDTEPDVLTNFDRDLGVRHGAELSFAVRVGYVLHLILVFPLVHFSLRATVYALLFEGPQRKPLSESWKRCLALTFGLLSLAYVGSTTVASIWTVFRLTGTTTAVSLAFTFPSLIALRMNSGEGYRLLGRIERLMCRFMLCFGVTVSVLGAIGNVYTIQSNSGFHFRISGSN